MAYCHTCRVLYELREKRDSGLPDHADTPIRAAVLYAYLEWGSGMRSHVICYNEKDHPLFGGKVMGTEGPGEGFVVLTDPGHGELATAADKATVETKAEHGGKEEEGDVFRVNDK